MDTLPLVFTVDASLKKILTDAQISTSPDYSEFKKGSGWLDSINQYTFKKTIHIEGPSAFYGGVYGPNSWTAEGGLCTMGAASYSHSPLPEGLTVGRYCSIAKGLKFLDFMHPINWISSSVAFFKPSNTKSLTSIHSLIESEISNKKSIRRPEFDPRNGKSYPSIGHDVWIGENVTLSMGIKIGTGAIVAAGSVVTKDVEPYAVVGGVPAKFIRTRFDLDVVDDLLRLEWWKYSFTDLLELQITEPRDFIEQLTQKILQKEISPWQPKKVSLPNDLIKLENENVS